MALEPLLPFFSSLPDFVQALALFATLQLALPGLACIICVYRGALRAHAVLFPRSSRRAFTRREIVSASQLLLGAHWSADHTDIIAEFLVPEFLCKEIIAKNRR